MLASIPGVHNVQTSLVLGRAEFDADAGLSIHEITSLVERQTEFKCTVRQEGHRLEVPIPKSSPAPALRLGNTSTASENPSYPAGVEDIKIIDSKGREWRSESANKSLRQRLGVKMLTSKPHKYSARISYNPYIVGARDLLEKSFGAPLSLAPLSSDHATATDANPLRETLYKTLLSALLTIPVLIMAWVSLPPHKIAHGYSSLALATLVQFIIAGPFYPKAFKALIFSGIIEMDLLIVISTTK